MEPDPEQAAYARDHHGLTVFPGRFEEAAFGAAPFDLILASHVIEHFPEPLAFLRQARTWPTRTPGSSWKPPTSWPPR